MSVGSQARYLLLLAGVAGLYYGAARIGYALEFAGWSPPSSGSRSAWISFLYLGGLGLWPGVVLGDLLRTTTPRCRSGSALGQTLGEPDEILIATLLLRRLVATRLRRSRASAVGAHAARVRH